MKRKDARSLSAGKQESLRYRAVRHVVFNGKKQIEVAEQLRVTRQAVGRWVKAYRNESDFEALRRKPQGRPRCRGRIKDQGKGIADCPYGQGQGEVDGGFRLGVARFGPRAAHWRGAVWQRRMGDG